MNFSIAPLTIAQWEERHNLFESVSIQDFWIFDKSKFMKFSSVRDYTDARKRVDFDEYIYKKIGLVYFLDVEEANLTIEFNYSLTSRTTNVNGHDRKQYFTYHNPEDISVQISNVRVRKCKTYDYCVLVSDSLEPFMEDRLRYILNLLLQKSLQEREELFLKKLQEMVSFASAIYGEKFMNRLKVIIGDSDREFSYYQTSVGSFDDGSYDKERTSINLKIAKIFH
ncbi:hypothetical protein [Paenibacillus polymyxa]|uniref:hypothetical protein n=1 Tax=Paenibacillus polymyxa TaxID=1406 RepID=UPI000CDAC23E|nr:hypothetical protein [Paenibacillus polymyxa]POR28467.1 hypothetical protein CG775_07655 [Paenibacillus polymyxa]